METKNEQDWEDLFQEFKELLEESTLLQYENGAGLSDKKLSRLWQLEHMLLKRLRTGKDR